MSESQNDNAVSEQDWNENPNEQDYNSRNEGNELNEQSPYDEEHKGQYDDGYRGNNNGVDKDGKIMPFIIEPFNKDDRLRERSSKPKLGLKRLTEDKKLVSVDIDIPIDENTVIKDKFDWDLTKDKISPTDFAKELVSSLKLPSEHMQKIKQQILSQIMEHIKTNTCQKQEERDMFNNQQQNALNKNNFGNRFNFTNEYLQDDPLEKEENEKKKMSRQRRTEMKRTNTTMLSQPNRYFKEKKMCRNCKNQNNAPGYECKNCKLPFELMQSLNFDDKRVKISAKYYEKIANKIPLLTYEAKKKNFQKEDFDSFYAIYKKIKQIFEQSEQLSKEHLNQVKYIMEKYHEYFLNGNLDFNDEDIIYDKDMKKGDKKQQDNKPRRARGRPRKIKIINDDLIPNQNPGSEQESSQGSESSSDDSSS